MARNGNRTAFATPSTIRSMVFLPAHDVGRVERTLGWGVDCICIDLEDLTPTAARAESLDSFAELARLITGAGSKLMVRVNTRTPDEFERDLDAVVSDDLHCINIPKVEEAADVRRVEEALAAVERARKVAPEHRALLRPIVENALAVRNAFEIASASPRVCYMGGVQGSWTGDLSTSIGYLPSPTGDETFVLRALVLVDVRAAGVPYPIGGGQIASTDPERLRAFYEQCRALGYSGVHCARSEESVRIANEVFAPKADEVPGMLELLAALEAAEQEGHTSVWLGERHYSLVCLPRLRDDVALARRIGLVP